MSTHRLANILRTVALVTAASGLVHCRNSAGVQSNQPPEPESPRPLPPRVGACPSSNPSNNTPCTEFAAGLNCEWYGVIQCTCQAATATTPTQQWSCVTRSAPGPLPPPELLG